ncbi:MAG: Uma2 family endonuclease [Caldilineaceae bacterium]|nr:Uma2 family endonuclease [Caldilineaceae bacterium]
MSRPLRWPQMPERAQSTEIHYPETDGKPMAESDLHRDIMLYLIRLLQRFFAGHTVYVSGNLLVYYEQGNRYKSVAPDCFVVRGVDPHLRKTYKIWEEGKAPEVVFEVTSHSTQNEDLGKKMRLYAQLEVQEYYLYDPTGDYLQPALRAFVLQGGGYVPMAPVREAAELGALALMPDPAEPPEFISQVLGLRITLDEANQLQLYDLTDGKRLLSDEEARQAAETAAQDARQRAEQEAQRASAAEAENARLRAELAKLRGAQ